MPPYLFKISRSNQPQTSSTADCRDDAAAKQEAAGMFADAARDISRQLKSIHDWQIEVEDDDGKSIFRIRLTAESPK
jgi:hypothetical protein